MARTAPSGSSTTIAPELKRCCRPLVRTVLVSVPGLDGRRHAPVAAEQIGDGRWSVAADLSTPGPTSIEVTVQRAGMADATHRYRWVVGGATSITRTATVSTAPIGDSLRRLADLLLAVVLGLAALAFLGRRPSNGRTSTADPSPAQAEVPDLVGASAD